MSDDQKINSASNALVLLKRLDQAQLGARDAAILYYIVRKPGANRNEIAQALGLHAESNARDPVKRLIKREFVEDRRNSEKRLVASLLHPTPAGIAMWESLVR